VLEQVGGAALVDRPKPLAVDDLVGLAVELARAVAEMHYRGVLHRDIAPANIVISPDGAPCMVIADSGWNRQPGPSRGRLCVSSR
jgi:serine/threonine protein kinase